MQTLERPDHRTSEELIQANPSLVQALKPRLTKYFPHVPTPKQQAFLLLNCRDAFYGGAAGGGKSDALLMAALQYVDVPGYNAILFRDTYKNLTLPEGLLTRSFEWLMGTDARWVGQFNRWEFPIVRYPWDKRKKEDLTPPTLSFSYLDGPNDHFNHQSAAYQFVGFDEVVNIRENQFRYLFTRLRRLMELSWLPLRIRSASNPPTREQIARGAYIKRDYVDAATRKPNVVYIPAKMQDNPYLDTEDYKKSLSYVDPVTRKQLEEGDWEVRVRGHIVSREDFQIIDQPFADVTSTVRFWDMAATEPSKDNKKPCWTAGVKMSRTKQGFIVVEDVIRVQKNPGQTETLIRQTAELDGHLTAIRMEQEGGSSGKTVIDHYFRNILNGWNFKGESPHGNKLQRYTPFANNVEAHNVYLVKAPWNAMYLDEAELFPDGEFVDMCDATGGAFETVNRGFGARASIVDEGTEVPDFVAEAPRGLAAGGVRQSMFED
jgi:predicted phage terminase large subunit-like protein